ncbi:MAG TPA: AAA family ATPase [Hyphomicrobiaceae bacterium]
MEKTSRITSVSLKNYKSIASARVSLSPLTVLVGRNGAGKSNFVEALWLLSDAVQSTLDHAIRQHGGIGDVRRRSGGHPTHFGISLRLQLADGRSAAYAFMVGATKDGGFTVQREKAAIGVDGLNDPHFELDDGVLVSKSTHLNLAPRISSDRLFLTYVSSIPEFRILFDTLSQMHFYSINPTEIRQPQPHDAGDVLLRSGKNIASLMRRLATDDPESFDRIQDYIRSIVPGLEGVEHESLGPTETLRFRQKVQTNKNPWRFYAAAMSDGTLRSLGILAALFQTNSRKVSPTLIGIEEPESTIHPGAASILTDALIEASKRHQVIATTHSPDLLDNANLSLESIRVVESVDGETIIGDADAAAKEAVRSKLYTPGELLRHGQINPAPPSRPQSDAINLFKFD